jgi:hypothetical protein
MIVYLPDKNIELEFPDGMSEDDMHDTIMQNFYLEQLRWGGKVRVIKGVKTDGKV